MRIEYAPKFKRHFKKKIKKFPLLQESFNIAFSKFLKNPYDPSLETHKLTGNMKAYWSFSVEHDCRVVFFFEDGDQAAVFVDIGSHDEVY